MSDPAKPDISRAEAALRRARHQIRNELQLLTSLHALHIRRVEDPRSRRELIRCYRRVGVVGVVHQLTADTGGAVSADTCLQTVADFLEASARTMEGCADFELSLDFESVRWHHDHATRIALIVDELFCNATDHALPHASRQELALSLRIVGGRSGGSRSGGSPSGGSPSGGSPSGGSPRACLCLRDWGPGLPAGFDPQAVDSLGLPMACAVAQQLGGSLELVPAPGGGTEARLWLPLELSVDKETGE